jgi:divalent anion:Na+ symporter, DASS family
MWIFSLLPEFVPALFVILISILLGVVPPEVALSGFGSKSFFMALSILGLSVVITVSGLSYRALLVLLRIGPANKVWYNICLFATGVALTPVVPTANGRISIVTPFLVDLLGAFDKKSGAAEAPRLTGSVITGISLLSAIFLSSKSVNFIVFGMLPTQDQQQFQFLNWLVAAAVCGGVMLVLFFFCSWLIFKNDSAPSIPKSLVSAQAKMLGPMRPAEWAGMIGLAILLVSFLTAALHRIEVPWVAMAILFTLLMFGFIQDKQFREKIDWNFLIFLGALIGIVASMQHTGLDVWLAKQLSFLNDYMANEFELFILMLTAAIFIVRLALPINAVVVIFAALLIPTAVNIGVNPWLIGFIILLMSESFIWPYQASYFVMFISIAGAKAQADDKRLIWMNFAIIVIKLAAIYASIPYWQYLGLL